MQVQLHPPGFQRGNGQQILDEQIQPLRVALDDFEEAVGDLGIIARAVEQRFHVALDERERRAQFVADVGDEFLARALQLLEPRQIVEDQNGAFALAGGVGDDGGVDLQPALVQFRQLELVIENLPFGLDALDEFVKFVQAQRFHDGFAAQLGLDAEQVFEGAVGEVNFPVAIQQQQAFEHGIEQNLLLRLGVDRCLLLAALVDFNLRRALSCCAEFRPPPEMKSGERGERESMATNHTGKG